MIRVIGDEIEFDGIAVARLIPGAAWPTLIESFVYDLNYADDLESENNEQEKTIEKLTKKIADLEAQSELDQEQVIELSHYRERAYNTIRFLETVISELTA